MITHPFTYQAPATIEEAVKRLGQNDDAKVIAGGHSLLPLMKLGLAQPETLVDLRRIGSLREIRTDADGTIVIGALVTHRDIAHDETVRAKLTALADAAGEIGDLQVRARGTIGGSLAHADPAADEPAPTLAYDATIRAIGPQGRRDIPARDYFKGAFETALAANEILAEVRFPAPAARTGGSYVKFAHPASGFAVTRIPSDRGRTRSHRFEGRRQGDRRSGREGSGWDHGALRPRRVRRIPQAPRHRLRETGDRTRHQARPRLTTRDILLRRRREGAGAVSLLRS